MRTHHLILTCLLCLATNSIFAQLKFKLQYIPALEGWGVYVKPEGVTPSLQTNTASGQVTLVTPISFQYTDRQDVSGMWDQNATVIAPQENPGKKYLSFGFQGDSPHIEYQAGMETLLFTFKKASGCTDSIYLIDNLTDPFNDLPNSLSSNPGNELSVFDYGNAFSTYNWSGNYALAAWNCNPDAFLLIEHPQDVYVNSGSPAQFSAKYANGAGGTTSFYWQISTDGGTTWASATGPIYSNASGSFNLNAGTNTLDISNSAGLNGAQYKVCYLPQGASSPICSNPATLHLSGDLTYTLHPEDLFFCQGGQPVFVACANIALGQFSWKWQSSFNNGATWTDLDLSSPEYSHTAGNSLMISGCDSLLINDLLGSGGLLFRAMAVSEGGASFPSQSAGISFANPAAIAQQPSNAQACVGLPAEFAVMVNNLSDSPINLVYQWQENAPGNNTWANLANNSTYSGVNSAMLSIGNVAGKNNYRYRCIVSANGCTNATSQAAQLQVKGDLTVTSQPEPATQYAGMGTQFAANISNGGTDAVNHQWEFSTDGGITWSNVTAGGVAGFSGINTSVLKIGEVDCLSGYRFRLWYWVSGCLAKQTEPATLTVLNPLSFIEQPQSLTVCSGETAAFSVSYQHLSPAPYKIQWQESADGGNTWTALIESAAAQGVDDDNLSVLSSAKNNYQYRCTLSTYGCAESISMPATLQLEGPLNVTQQPQDATQYTGLATEFQATVSNAGAGDLSYQWEYKTDPGAAWTDVSTGGAPLFSGENTPKLSIGNVTGLNGYYFRLRFGTVHCTANFTEPAHLAVLEPVEFTLHPQSTIVCEGESACLSALAVNATGSDVGYRWQSSTDGGATWADVPNSGVFTNNSTGLCISNVTGLNGRCFRVLASCCGSSNSTISETACLTVNTTPVVSAQPQDVMTCAGNPIVFNAKIDYTGTAPLSYQWQKSVGNAGAWQDVVNGGVFQNANTPQLKITSATDLYHVRFRLKVSGGCATVHSAAATVNLGGPIVFLQNPQDVYSCPDKTVYFTCQSVNGASPYVFTYFQWQASYDGVNWQDLTDDYYYQNTSGFSNEYEFDTLTVSNFDNYLGWKYRLGVRSEGCDFVYSEPAGLYHSDCSGYNLGAGNSSNTAFGQQWQGAVPEVSPNPATDLVQVKFTGGIPETGGTLRLWNVQGVLIQSIDVHAPLVEIGVAELAAGAYFFTWTTPFTTPVSMKFVKQ